MREKLAELAHEQWSGWMRYLFSKGTFNNDGTWTMPAWAVDRWKEQMETPYLDLSESDQDSDRKEADKFLAIMRGLKTKAANVCHNCGTEMVKMRFETDDGWIYGWLCECEGVEDAEIAKAVEEEIRYGTATRVTIVPTHVDKEPKEEGIAF